jgi:hypothetical protein
VIAPAGLWSLAIDFWTAVLGLLEHFVALHVTVRRVPQCCWSWRHIKPVIGVRYTSRTH